MMSDHWKKLANLLGTPGPADPPETAAKSDTSNAPAAKKPEPIRPVPPPPAQPVAPQLPPVSHAAPRKRSSMWGDDLETEAAPVPASEPSSSVEPRPRTEDLSPRRSDAPARSPQSTDRPAAERPFGERRGAEPVRGESGGRRRSDDRDEKPVAVRPTDALGEMSVVKREPPVPGFEVPESRSPERPETPAKRSAWDTLISTLGIKPAAEPEPPRAATPPPAAPRREPEPAETAGFGGFGAGLIDIEGTASRSEATVTPGRRDEPFAERETDEDRPRGRGRRGSARHRGRAEEPERQPSAEIGWDPEPQTATTRRGPEEPAGDRPRRTDDRVSGDVRPAAFGDLEGEGEESRRRRPRRRGQRQTMAVADVELDRPGREPGSGRAPGAGRADSDLTSSRREESAGRDRGPRRERGDDSRGERGTRPGRFEDERRGEPRAAHRRGEIGETQLPEDDDLEGFGGDLLAEIAPPRSDEEGPSRPRRRRGRRGRGGAGARSEEAPRGEEIVRSEVEAEEEDPWAPVSAAPEFDDDYEDDDEAEQLRRRSRGGRGRGARREVAAGPRGEAAVTGGEEAPRSERVVAAKQYSAPTWLETVTLLVDANIQRRGSGGGGSGRGPQGGRGGRR